MSTLKPTPEQDAIVSAFAQGQTLTVEAAAGSGKTSTLVMAAGARPSSLGIYVAFNKALADDAKRKFPSNVSCRTAHSLAYGAIGHRFKERLNGPRVPIWHTVRTLGVEETTISDRLVLPPEHLARLAMDAVGKFCNSDLDEPDGSLVPYTAPLTDEEMSLLRAAALPLMQRAWADMSSEEGTLRFSHDVYLKLWQLSRPVLECDFLLLDEGQDLSPCMVDVFERQDGMQRVLVGDSAQAIYGWRGAVDAMDSFTSDARLTLSKSFRFGPPIAAEANKWLRLLRSPITITGNEQVASRIRGEDDDQEKAGAILCRTNSEAMAQCLGALSRGTRVALVGGGDALRALVSAALELKAGRKTSHPELFLFKNWKELQEYVEKEESAADLKVFVSLVEQYGPECLLRALNELVPESSAELIISTAHKAKGREWPAVRIAGDFPAPAMNDADRRAGRREDVADQDLKLAYVATTRAKNVLDRGGLAWVDRWLARRGL